MSEASAETLVTVVVPTRNSAAHIGPCLESIRAQTYEPIESSSSTTTRRTRRGSSRSRSPTGSLVIGPERSAQRNEGARAGSGDYLLFVDSDMTLARDVVGQCVEAVRADPARTVVVIPEVSVGTGFWARCKALERSCYVGDETIEAARFFPTELFRELGGFDERLPAGPEDWDLHERARLAGARVARTSAFIRHDEGALRLGRTRREEVPLRRLDGRVHAPASPARAPPASGRSSRVRP